MERINIIDGRMLLISSIKDLGQTSHLRSKTIADHGLIRFNAQSSDRYKWDPYKSISENKKALFLQKIRS